MSQDKEVGNQMEALNYQFILRRPSLVFEEQIEVIREIKNSCCRIIIILKFTLPHANALLTLRVNLVVSYK